MPSTVKVRCKCGTVFTARVADRKRGWAKSCSKSCAAKRRDNSDYYRNQRRIADRESVEDGFHPHDPYSLGQE